jgi:ABC-type bacteriocin/lantibiotic exporter with double-glycine peptidase domain
MITLLPVDQREGMGRCGPACLKMVLHYYGIKVTEASLAKQMKTSAAFGTSAQKMVEVAKKYKLKGYIQDLASIKDLRKLLKKGIPVIIDWFKVDDGHYSVVTDIDQENIYLQDPALGYLRGMDINFFKRVWFDFFGGMMKTKNDLILRRMIVIYK